MNTIDAPSVAIWLWRAKLSCTRASYAGSLGFQTGLTSRLMRELAEGGSSSRAPNEERRGEYEISAPAPPAQSGRPARKRAEDEPTLPISPLYRYCVAPAPAHSSLRSPNRDHHVRNHRDIVAPIAHCPTTDAGRHGGTASSRARRPAILDGTRLPRRPRPHEVVDHRSHYRRPADLERRRHHPHRRERRVLRLRAHSRRSRVARSSLPHEIRQRDRAALVRGLRAGMSASPSRRIRLRHLGRAQSAIDCGTRSLRCEAAFL